MNVRLTHTKAMKRYEQVTDQHLVDAYIERNDMTPIAEDLYECAGGHVWHIDDIVTEINLERV